MAKSIEAQVGALRKTIEAPRSSKRTILGAEKKLESLRLSCERKVKPVRYRGEKPSMETLLEPFKEHANIFYVNAVEREQFMREKRRRLDARFLGAEKRAAARAAKTQKKSVA